MSSCVVPPALFYFFGGFFNPVLVDPYHMTLFSYRKECQPAISVRLPMAFVGGVGGFFLLLFFFAELELSLYGTAVGTGEDIFLTFQGPPALPASGYQFEVDLDYIHQFAAPILMRVCEGSHVLVSCARAFGS